MKSLGWTALDWIGTYLPSPSNRDEPFVLSDEQARMLLGWYALNDRGEFVYRRGLWCGPKGVGKSPVAAALCLFEFAGPCLFDGFDAEGKPVGRPWGTEGSPPAVVQILASSEDQAQATIYALVFETLSVNDGAAARDLGIDLGRTRLYLRDAAGAKLEALTASAPAREGARSTFVAVDESNGLTRRNGGTSLYRTAARNAAKVGGRVLQFANAPVLGSESVAEETLDAAALDEPGLFVEARQPSTVPQPDMSDAELLRLLDEVYGGVPWVDRRRLLAEIRDTSVPWTESIRYYLNVASPGLGALLDPVVWASLKLDREAPHDDRIALGFTGTRSSAALVGATLDAERPHLFVLDAWEKPEGADATWRVPRGEVHTAIADAFAANTVVSMYVNADAWRSETEAWADQYGENVVLEFRWSAPTRSGPAVDRFRSDAEEGALSHDGNPTLARQIANARVRTTASGSITVEGAGPSREIDTTIAAVLAHAARATAPKTPQVFFAWS